MKQRIWKAYGEAPAPHKGWYSRGYVPHFDMPGLVQSVGFRIYDSVPANVLREWRDVLKASKKDGDLARVLRLRKRIKKFEDTGYGACYLKDHRVATLVENALLHFDAKRYRQIAWCIMPNHVHTAVETVKGWTLPGVLHSWKSFTSKEANRILGRTGEFWMDDYFDRYVRDARHLHNVINYIHMNPVKAGFVRIPEDWPYSSARLFTERMERAGRPLAQ